MVDIYHLASPLSNVPYTFEKQLVYLLNQKVYAPIEINPTE